MCHYPLVFAPNGPPRPDALPLERAFLNVHPPPGILTGPEAMCEGVSYPAT